MKIFTSLLSLFMLCNTLTFAAPAGRLPGGERQAGIGVYAYSAGEGANRFVEESSSLSDIPGEDSQPPPNNGSSSQAGNESSSGEESPSSSSADSSSRPEEQDGSDGSHPLPDDSSSDEGDSPSQPESGSDPSSQPPDSDSTDGAPQPPSDDQSSPGGEEVPLQIVGFAPLEADVANQSYILGAAEEDFVLPPVLEAAAVSDAGETHSVTLEPVSWECTDFDAALPGTYLFTPVLPAQVAPPAWAEGEIPPPGVAYTLAEGAVLPVIEVTLEEDTLLAPMALVPIPAATPFATIKSMIEAAAPGDIFEFEAGTFAFENVININVPLTIRGAGRDSTIFTAANGARHFMVNLTVSATFEALAMNGPAVPTVEAVNGGVQGGSAITMTDVAMNGNVQDTNGLGGGAIASNGPITLTSCLFSSNRTVTGGGAIYATSASAVTTVSGCTFTQNIAALDGGAMFANRINITGSTFTSNSAVFRDGGAIFTTVAGSISGGCVFTGNQAAAGGGAVYASVAGETLTVGNSTFTGNNAVSGGGALFAQRLAMTNANFTDNHTTAGHGGAVRFTQDSTITGGALTSNSATGGEGGAVYGSGLLTMQNAAFESNTATGSGGAVRMTFSTIIAGCTFTDNHSAGNGGGAVIISAGGSFVSISDTVFSQNSTTGAAGLGGALYTSLPGALLSCEFLGNQSLLHGGGAYFNAATDLEECTFDGNTAGDRGGGALIAGTNTLTNCTFVNNTAVSLGGGFISNLPSNVSTITGCTFQENHAGGRGGGITVGILRMTDTLVTGNTSQTTGGGITTGTQQGASTVENCIITNNTAVSNGGGLESRTPATVTGTTFSGNQSGQQGGGIYTQQPLTVQNATLNGNTATTNGGGVGASAVAVNLTNSTLYANTAAAGGGLYAQGAAGLTNCTVALNTGTTGGVAAGGGATLLGCIISGNGAQDVSGLADAFPTAPDYNLIGLPDGIALSDIFAGGAPVLANNGGITETVMISAVGYAAEAIPADAYAYPAADQRGFSRPQGYFADVGAVEIDASPDLSLTPERVVLTVGDAFLLTASFLPPMFANKNVIWSNSAPGIAGISGRGLMVNVSALAVGTTTITVTSVVGGASATCEVVVVAHEYVFIVPFPTVTNNTVPASGTANGPYGKLDSLVINGEVLVLGVDYTAAPDSDGFTVFELQPAYLATLLNGSYYVQALYTDGVASTILIVDLPNPPQPVYTITSSAGPGGTIEPLGDVSVSENGTASFIFTPNDGYAVTRVEIDGVAITTSANFYIFRDVDRNHAIHVVFGLSDDGGNGTGGNGTGGNGQGIPPAPATGSGAVAQTGDDSPIILWALAIISGVLLAGLIFLRRRIVK